MWLRNRLFATLLVLISFVAGAFPALAGDSAVAIVQGYSNDGRYFAFEEFGIQDGSGFAYSNIYAVDLDTDRWVVGTPIRIQAEEDTIPLPVIRERAYEQALPRLEGLGITQPAQVAALIGDGVPNADGTTLTFGLPVHTGMPGQVRNRYDLKLETFETESGAPCLDWFDAKPIGFSVSITDFGVTREAYRDGSLPRSRGCPQTYRFYGVYLPYMATDISRAVALVSVYAYGFEGPDRRFVAVPLSFSY